MKLLIGIPSPRDIQQFTEATAKLPYDKYWIKYTEHGAAMRELQEFFLSHKEYTHLAILPDDLIVTPEQLDRLAGDADDYNLPVIGGVCMCNTEDHPVDSLNISLTHVTNPNRQLRRYELLSKTVYDQLLSTLPEPKIVQTKWQGFPCTIIQRFVLERVWLRVDGYYNNFKGGCCADNCFNWQLAEQNIQAYSDLSVFLQHLPKMREVNNYVGIKEPYTKLEKYDN